jgi:RNA polymerase sigma-70 factor (ECF subfamily)
MGEVRSGVFTMDIPSSPSPVADVAALGQLLQEYRPRLLAMLQRRLDPKLNPRLDAEEILSMAFLQARRRWAAFQTRPAMKPYPWMYRITLDCLIEAWRRETRGPRDVRRAMPLPDATSLQLGLGLVHPGTSPSEALARDEVRAQVRLVMSQLKDSEREILLMRHFDDLSYADISAVLGITENTAMKRYGRALDKLSDRWMEMFPDHE